MVVEEISEGGVAAKVGLRRGDRIVALEQRLLTGTSSFEREIRNFQEAEGIELLYVRQEKLHRVRVMPHKSDRISTDGESQARSHGQFLWGSKKLSGFGAAGSGDCEPRWVKRFWRARSSLGRLAPTGASRSKIDGIESLRREPTLDLPRVTSLFAGVVHSYR